MEHAIHSAELFSKCKPILVGTGGLTLFPGTPRLEEAEKGEFTPLTEKEILIELKAFVEHLICDCYFNTNHTSGINLSGTDFFKKKDMLKAKEIGMEAYHDEQRRKMEILNYLLEEYDDGGREKFFCLSVNRLPIDDLRSVMEQADMQKDT